jgi:hypothetical protein
MPEFTLTFRESSAQSKSGDTQAPVLAEYIGEKARTIVRAGISAGDVYTFSNAEGVAFKAKHGRTPQLNQRVVPGRWFHASNGDLTAVTLWMSPNLGV